MRRIRYLTLILVAWLLVIPTLHADSSAKMIYRKPLPSLPLTFNPKLYGDAYSILIATQIFDRLFDVDELLNIRPKLVTKWESEQDGRIWKLHLRDDVTFHNGKKFTAEDVAFTIKKLLEKDSVKFPELSVIKGGKEYHEGKAKDVSGIKILSPNTIQIELENPFSPFLAMFTAPNTEIIPNNYGGMTEAEFAKKPIGTGAFKFESYIPGKTVTVTANDKYFLGKPKLRKIIFEKTDRASAINGFNHHYYQDLEWFLDVEPKELTTTFTMVKLPVADTSILAFNLRRKPFDNIHLRKAIQYALNKKNLITNCIPDRKVAVGYVPPGVGGYYPEMQDVPYNLTKAKEELKLAKLTPEQLNKTYTILRPDNHVCKDLFAKFMQDSLKKIGLKVKVKYLPLSDIYSKHYWTRNYDMFNIIFPSDYTEGLFMLGVFRSDHPDNFTGVKNAEVNKLLDAASNRSDRFERFKIYRQIQEVLQKEAVIVPLFYGIYASIYQSDVRGIVRPPLTTYLIPMWPIYFAKEHSPIKSN